MENKKSIRETYNDLQIDFVRGFSDQKGFGVGWMSYKSGNGTIAVHVEDDGSILIDSECMSTNDDKEFVKLVFEKLIEKAKIK